MDHARKIHDVLFISNRVVTYKAAAAILNVSVNEAKTILKDYIKDKKDSINTSYVVGGITTHNTHKITVVSDTKYEQVKQKFKTITVDHIYSIQLSPLSDWVVVFNVDDMLYDQEDTQKEESPKPIKEEPKSPVKKESHSPATNKKATQATSKKGAISNFFSQSQAKSTKSKTEVKKEPIENESKSTSKQKTSKPNALTSFMSKNKTFNKENVSKIINKLNLKEETVNEELNDSEDEEIVKCKKRTRAILLDDDEEEEDTTPSKCQKVDILDDPDIQSDEDIFGSPEKETTNDKNDEEKVETVVEVKEAPAPIETKSDEDTEIEDDAVMYQDDDGYFVTETKSAKKKTPKKKSPIKKKDSVVEVVEKKTKKEVIQKIKKNTNQNTLFTYFQKK